MKVIHLIVIGKNKDDTLISWEEDYKKRLKTLKLKIHELRNLDTKDKNDRQAIQKSKSISKKEFPAIYLLDEKGKSATSKNFSTWLFNEIQTNDCPIFVIGGAEGHGKEIKKVAKSSFRLSDLTLPHRLARTIFVEQIYRSETICLGHPYHK